MTTVLAPETATPHPSHIAYKGFTWMPFEGVRKNVRVRAYPNGARAFALHYGMEWATMEIPGDTNEETIRRRIDSIWDDPAVEMTATLTGYPAKMPDGEWGVGFDQPASALNLPAVVTVTARSGKSWEVLVKEVEAAGKGKSKGYSVNLTNSMVIQPGKEGPRQSVSREPVYDAEKKAKPSQSRSNKATTKQLGYLEKLCNQSGVAVTDGGDTADGIMREIESGRMTKKRASSLIAQMRDVV